MNEIKLIGLYFFICDSYSRELRWHCQRFSPNQSQEFTDEELLTVYLYSVAVEEKVKIKSVHRYAQSYLREWFPQLPSYQAFNARLNRLACVLPKLAECLLQAVEGGDVCLGMSVVDSLPIMVCSPKRKCKVARQWVDKGFCSTKNTHYWGAKLHSLGCHRPHRLPLPEFLLLTPASENDLTTLRPLLPQLAHRAIFGDKSYCDKPLNEQLIQQQNTFIYTPVKLVKGQSLENRQFNKAADELFSTAVSKIRQPIESFFNWLIEHTDIQRASKVRSLNGLFVHVFGRISAALTLWAIF